MKIAARTAFLALLALLAPAAAGAPLSDPSVEFVVGPNPGSLDQFIDITADEGSWVFPMLRVSIGGGNMSATLRGDLIAACPFLEDVVPYTVAGLPPDHPNIIVPHSEFFATASAPIATPLNDDVVRLLYQPILTLSPTRRWSAMPVSWLSPMDIPDHDEQAIAQASIAAWTPLTDPRGPDPSHGYDPAYFDLDLVMQHLVARQAASAGALARDFFVDGPAGDGRSWHQIAVQTGALMVKGQALALKGQEVAPSDVTSDEETTVGLKGLAATPPKLPIPKISIESTVSFGIHEPDNPIDLTSMSTSVSTSGVGYVYGSNLVGTPTIVIQAQNMVGMLPLTWEAPGKWSYDPSSLNPGPATYLRVKNPGSSPISLAGHPDQSFTITSP